MRRLVSPGAMRRLAPLGRVGSLTRLGPPLAGVGLALVAAGCGVSIAGADREHPTAAVAAPGVVRLAARTAPSLPPRPAGELDVDGSTQGSLTPAVASAIGSGLRVNIHGNGEQTAFGELCAGRIDAVASSSPITPDEWDACARNGVKPVQFQVAADATVVVTRSESDVGVDCLTLGQVQEIFRAGSPIDNWSQVDGFDVPLHTAGPNPQGDGFGFFSRTVLLAGTPTITAFRSDYEQQPTDDGIRLAVIGSDSERQTAALQAKAHHDLGALRISIAQNLTFVHSAQFQVTKGQHDQRPAAQQASDLATLQQAQSQSAALLRDLGPAIRFARSTDAAAAALAARAGVVGFVRFSYYERHEDQLRPVEIDPSTSTTSPTVHNCIFPSQQTVTDATFPLARQLLITVSMAGLRRAEVQRFLATYLARSSALARSALLLPLSDSLIATEKGWLANPSDAPVVVYPPAAERAKRQAAAQAAAQARTAPSNPPAHTSTSPSQTPTSAAKTSTSFSQTSTSSAPITAPQPAGY